MSVVTTVVIITTAPDENITKCLNELRSFEWDGRIADFGPDIDPCGPLVGGTKCAESSIHIGAFNHLPWTEFVGFIETLPWNPYSQTTVVLQSSDLSATQIWTMPTMWD